MSFLTTYNGENAETFTAMHTRTTIPIRERRLEGFLMLFEGEDVTNVGSIAMGCCVHIFFKEVLENIHIQLT